MPEVPGNSTWSSRLRRASSCIRADTRLLKAVGRWPVEMWLIKARWVWPAELRRIMVHISQMLWPIIIQVLGGTQILDLCQGGQAVGGGWGWGHAQGSCIVQALLTVGSAQAGLPFVLKGWDVAADGGLLLL